MNRLSADQYKTCRGNHEQKDFYGTQIRKKEKHILRLGFQNIGGVPTTGGKAKDDFIRAGISTYKFDIFGIAEVNVNWRVIGEGDRNTNRTRYWWETSQLAQAFNVCF
ncbi:MAG: hypothetical protein ACK53Y_16235, partial [bacterium]